MDLQTTTAPEGRPNWEIIVVVAAIAVVAVLVIVTFAYLPSFFSGITGSGRLVTEQENFTGFTSVSIADGFRFTIVQSPAYHVNVTIDDNLVKYVQVSQAGGSLHIGMAPGHSVTSSSLQVSISMPDLTSLDVSEGVSGNTQGFISTHAFTVTASDGSSVVAQGNATDLTANASNGSRLDLSSLRVSNAVVDVSGGSSATVHPDGRLDATASDGSQLYYIGNPTMGNISVSGGSTISKQ